MTEKGCKYCRYDKHGDTQTLIMDKKETIAIDSDTSELFLLKSDGSELNRKICYCPMCGRKLEA